MSENETAKIRVAMVDDHEMFRAGVIATLRDSFDIVGQAADVLPHYRVSGIVGFGCAAGCGVGDSRRRPGLCNQDDYRR